MAVKTEVEMLGRDDLKGDMYSRQSAVDVEGEKLNMRVKVLEMIHDGHAFAEMSELETCYSLGHRDMVFT